MPSLMSARLKWLYRLRGLCTLNSSKKPSLINLLVVYTCTLGPPGRLAIYELMEYALFILCIYLTATQLPI